MHVKFFVEIIYKHTNYTCRTLCKSLTTNMATVEKFEVISEIRMDKPVGLYRVLLNVNNNNNNNKQYNPNNNSNILQHIHYLRQQ
jgi:hypothetical protein